MSNSTEKNNIILEGIKTHNLNNISVKIPKNSLIVFTGVSGSGKTSLAFDTIYAESQRRYIESLSVYARKFLDIMPKPDFDDIKGLSPSIAVTQRGVQHNPRSTVAIMTEIYDYLRLLFARIGILHSPATGQPIIITPINKIVEHLLSNFEDKKSYILAPINKKEDIPSLQNHGFQRILLDGKLLEIEQIPEHTNLNKNNIDIVIDRLRITHENKRRLADSIDIACKHGNGIVKIFDVESSIIQTFSKKHVCPVSGFSLKEIEPNMFSFNSPFGACEDCHGLGALKKFTEELIVPNNSLNVLTGAIKPWAKLEQSIIKELLAPIFQKHKTSLFAAYQKLPKKLRHELIFGSKEFEGIANILEKQYKKTESVWRKIEIGQYQTTEKCSKCEGKRLNKTALLIKVLDLTISDVTAMSVKNAKFFFETLNENISTQKQIIAEKIIKEIQIRLNFLYNIGLGYLTLDRPAPTLSGGESQRINLASQIGSKLTGVLYILDEPSIGLHQRDNHRLIEALKELKDIGNTVLIVEHDEETILESDYIIDVGPNAGILGGNIVYSGTIDGIKKVNDSLTGQYLSGKKAIFTPKKRRPFEKDNKISITNASTNNLKNISVDFPIGCFTCVTGVSGCGKSSLVMETLYPLIKCHLDGKNQKSSTTKIIGHEKIKRLVVIDQSPIGRTPRSNPATYTDIFSSIRDFFTTLPESKARGYAAGRFSFNVDGGRCIACKGEGFSRVEMHFMSDVFVECDICKGQRFNEETLEIKYKNKSIADILNLSIDEARDFFDAIPKLSKKLVFLQDVGLGYIKLGQSSTTLSGGEAQRVKLAKELSRAEIENTLYILDEPTTGLHFEDVNKLLKILHRLVDNGNTLVTIEHNLDFIKTADWIIDLGPEGGDEGGQLVFASTPEELIKHKTSHTGQYLKKYINKK